MKGALMNKALGQFTAKDLPWKLIIILVALGVLLPASKALGITNGLPPAVIGGTFVGIRLLWIIIVLVVHDKKPFWTLLAANVLYELLAIIPQQIFWNYGSAARIYAATSPLIMGVVIGMVSGAIATGIQSLTNKRTPTP